MSSRALVALVCAVAAILAFSARPGAATKTADVSSQYCVFVAVPGGAGFRFLARGVGGSWSPNGASLAIGLVDASVTSPTVSGTRLIRRSGALIRVLPQVEVAWLDAGRLLVLNARGASFSYGVAHLDGAPTRTLRAPPLKRVLDVSVATVARLIVFAGLRNDSDEHKTFVFLTAEGRVVATSRAHTSTLDGVSPDGRRIAVTNDRSVAGRSTGVVLRNGQGGVHLASVVASELAWSPTSTRLAVILRDTGSDLNATPATAGLYVHDVARKGSFRRIVRRSVVGATWSPDGTRISYYAGGTLFTVRAAAGAPTRIAPGAEGTAWSPDGTRIAYAKGGAIFTAPAVGGTPTRITPVAGYAFPTWSPDGKLIAFTRFRKEGTSAPPCPAA